MWIYLEMLDPEDRDSFREIYEKNYLRMYHVAFSLLKQQADAENAVHDAFLKLAECYRRYKELDTDAMYLLCLTIARNKAYDILRKQKYFSDREIDPESENLVERDAWSCIEEKEAENYFLERISMLSEPLKMVLVLKYHYGFKNEEIAKILDISKRAVEMRLHRATKKLREEWENGKEQF